MVSKIYSKFIAPVLRKMNTIRCSPADLMFLQVFNGEYCHPDTIVKYLYIENHYGKNDFGKDLYIKQQLARGTVKDIKAITDKFDTLIKSIEDNGFDINCTIGVDKNFYLRDGSHRSAMSMYLGLSEIKVNYLNMVYPRNYRFSWFEENGFTVDELAIIKNKLSLLMDKANEPLNIVLFGNSADNAELAAELLSQYGTVISCNHYHLSENQCSDICRDIAKAANLYNKKHAKISATYNKIAVIQLKLTEPHMTAVENNEPAILKKYINYRIPLIKQTAEIRKALTEKISVMENQLFIPQNFLVNSKFGHIIGDL